VPRPDRAVLGELDGVDREVEHDLLQPRRIADHCRRQVGPGHGADGEALFGGFRRHDADRMIKQCRG
jgi:hypothetical protein